MIILVVDDVQDNAELLHRWLSRRGHEIHLACDGAEAVDKAKATRPDLIFMDISMPVMSGLDATSLIRADAHIGGTPIVALTAHAMAEERAECIAAGCDDVATKPVDFTVLNDIVARYSPDNWTRGAA